MTNQHRLGATDLSVSPIGLGLAALGRPGYINLGHAQDLEQNYDVRAMETQTHNVLDAAWKAGVRYFDAARSYGKAEQFLGNWLRARQIPRGAITVGSKWGYTYTAGWQVDAGTHEVKEHTLPVLQHQWRESRGELGDYLRLYQIHSATLESGVLENGEVLAELMRLKRDGCRIGLSVSGARQPEVITRAIEIEMEGAPLFDSVQATWNLLERSTTPALQAAHERGIGVIIKEALANGRLTPRNDAPAFAARRAQLEREAARLGTTIDALALAAVIARPWVDIVLSGAATATHLLSNLKALDVSWDDAAEAELDELVEAPERYWEQRSHLPWN